MRLIATVVLFATAIVSWAKGSTYVFTHLAGPPAGLRGVLSADRPQVYGLTCIAADAGGNVYASSAHRLLRIASGSDVQLIAGTLTETGSADGSGVAARFHEPRGVAIDNMGNVYIADVFNRTIRKVTPAGVVTTLAGTPGAAPATVDGEGAAARFHTLSDLAIDRSGNLYASDLHAHTVRKISPTGVVTTIAGAPDTPGAVDGAGGAARLRNPQGLAVSSDGILYVCDTGNSTIRKIASDGAVTTLAGAAGQTGSTDGIGSGARFYLPRGITVDALGDVWVADTGNSIIRRISSTGSVVTVAGSPGQRANKEGMGSAARFDTPTGMAIDAAGRIYVVDEAAGLIRTMTSDGLVIGFYGGDGSGNLDGLKDAARFDTPWGIAVDSGGNVYVADSGSSTIRRVAADGSTATFAGAPYENGAADGVGTSARFFWPRGLAIDRNGNIYVADTGNNTIRRISAGGTVTTLAGQAGVRGSADGLASAASFTEPRGVAVDDAGNVYVADTVNRTIRRISPAGLVTTVAGSVGTPGLQDGVGTAALFDAPHSIAVDAAGNLYVGDSSFHDSQGIPGNNVIRKITPAGVVTTLAGGRKFAEPYGIVAKANGILLVGEYTYDRILELAPDGTVTILGGAAGSRGDADGAGPLARFDRPTGLALDREGNIYVADSGNHAMRKGTFTSTVAPSLTWAAPATMVEGATLTAEQLNATADVPGTFFYSPGPGSVMSAGRHTLTVTFVPTDLASYSTVTRSVTLVVLPKNSTARLVALAARAAAGSGDQTLIMGFVVDGNKEVLVQGVGPAIAGSVPTALVDPRLELFRYQGGSFTKVDENNDWVNSSAITEARARFGASALAAGSKDAALLKNISGGVYTAHVASDGAAGVALVEAYDADGGGSSRLMALSTRTVAGAGDATLIAGFVLEGNGPKTVLIRGLGPELALRGVQGVLTDPKITVYRGSNLVGSNEDWGGTQELKETFSAVGADQLASDTSKDAALLVTLDPGAYTVHVTGAAGTTGVALVEIFDVE